MNSFYTPFSLLKFFPRFSTFSRNTRIAIRFPYYVNLFMKTHSCCRFRKQRAPRKMFKLTRANITWLILSIAVVAAATTSTSASMLLEELSPGNVLILYILYRHCLLPFPNQPTIDECRLCLITQRSICNQFKSDRIEK